MSFTEKDKTKFQLSWVSEICRHMIKWRPCHGDVRQCRDGKSCQAGQCGKTVARLGLAITGSSWDEIESPLLAALI